MCMYKVLIKQTYEHGLTSTNTDSIFNMQDIKLSKYE